MRKFLSFTLGAMLGGVVGATLAMMYAPSNGGQLRSELCAEATRIRDEVKKAAADRRAELEEELADLRAPYSNQN
jgi:gas vesicle protein